MINVTPFGRPDAPPVLLTAHCLSSERWLQEWANHGQPSGAGMFVDQQRHLSTSGITCQNVNKRDQYSASMLPDWTRQTRTMPATTMPKGCCWPTEALASPLDSLLWWPHRSVVPSSTGHLKKWTSGVSSGAWHPSPWMSTSSSTDSGRSVTLVDACALTTEFARHRRPHVEGTHVHHAHV